MLTQDRQVLQKIIDGKKQSLLIADFRWKDAVNSSPANFAKHNRLKARVNKLTDDLASLNRIMTGTSY